MSGGGGGSERGGGPRGGRRGFFRLGLERLRESVVEAAEVLAEEASKQAQREVTPAPRTTTSGDREFHRARVRGLDGSAGSGRRLVRPPGAVAEPRFLELCVRCSACADACVPGAIIRTGPHWGPALELTPSLIVEERACALCDGVPCAAACETGALVPLRAAEIRLGLAAVDPQLCRNELGERCTDCGDACPVAGALTVPRRRGRPQVPQIDPLLCTGCGQCVVACRAYPRALRVVPG